MEVHLNHHIYDYGRPKDPATSLIPARIHLIYPVYLHKDTTEIWLS